MCGITGFTGANRALPFLMQGLEKLEYRGYDSAGITLADESGLKTFKTKGRLSGLEDILKSVETNQLTGIGHTRWATHGVPSNINAHPHMNEDETIAIVHNGIIENYAVLKEELLKLGYAFQSETDSEVVVLLVDYYFKQLQDMHQALQATLKKLEGSWALCAVNVKEPNTIYCAKKESPMVLGKCDQGTFCASDAAALIEYTKDIYPLNDGDTAILTPSTLTVFNQEGEVYEPHWVTFPYDVKAAQKGGYDSFMMKEIHEQPSVIRETLRGRFKNHAIYLPMIDELNVDWDNITQAYWIACGTAYHACIYAQSIFRKYAHVPSTVIPASEFRYMEPDLDEHTLCIFVSQSGETADTLAALKLAKANGSTTVSVVNVLGSSIARQTDAVIYTAAGPEISVASTKAYTTQIVLLYVLALKIAMMMGKEVTDLEEKIHGLNQIPEIVEKTLTYSEEIKELAKLLNDQKDAYFIGRLLDHPTALEGALKLKEISYVHADAYYAGELKHGPIALIEKHTVVVAMATQPTVAAKTISNIQETIARGAEIILITTNDIQADGFRHVIRIPDTYKELTPVPCAVLLQLFAYYVAMEKGCDIDKPRNLAKSVTVE